MKITELLGFVGRLKLVQGVERDLRKRRRIGTLAGLAAILPQVVVAARENDYLAKLGGFLSNLVRGHWRNLVGGTEGLDGNELVAAGALIAGTTVFVLLRRTRLLLRDSEEPFRYTFSVHPFRCVTISAAGADKEGKELSEPPSGRFRLLHHDLMDRLSFGVGRLSLLNVEAVPATDQRDLSSHVHVSGHYLIRDAQGGSGAPTSADGAKRQTVEIRPRIRVGAPDRPEQLAQRIDLKAITIEDGDVTAATYAQVVEHVYSRIATTLYQQIREDIREKVKLYPTPYLRAVGLFHEAQDFEQSSTVDAYTHAIDLYREALHYFDVRPMSGLSRWFLGTLLFWRWVRRSQLLEARARVAYCRCLISRRIVSGLAGRTQNPLFEVPDQLEQATSTLQRLYACMSPRASRRRMQASEPWGTSSEAAETSRWTSFTLIDRYLTYPKDVAAARIRPIFDEHRRALFETYSVYSLAWSQLEANERARQKLELARATAPDLVENSPLFLLAGAQTRPRLADKLQLLLKASELAPTSEIVKFELACVMRARFRQRNELSLERATPIIDAYQEVQRINPGNIGAYAANGHIWWLLENHEEATRAYRDGMSVKAIRQQTFVGDLNYGLARIAAENGRFNEALDLYEQAVAGDPGVGSYSPESRPSNSYYERITLSIQSRYERFLDRVRQHVKAMENAGSVSERAAKDAIFKDAAGKEVSSRTRDAVYSFALNDYANACLQYHVRSGRTDFVERAIAHYKEAVEHNPESAVAYFNLSGALSWAPTGAEDGVAYLEKACELEPGWTALLVQSIETTLQSMRDRAAERKKLEAEGKKLENEIDQLKKETQPMAPSSSASLYATAGSTRGGRGDEEVQLRVKQAQIDKDLKTTQEGLRKVVERQQNLKDPPRTQVLSKLDQILRRSSFHSYFEGIDLDNPDRAIARILKAPIRKDRIDESFVGLLRVWALFLCEGQEQEGLALRGIELSRHILKSFYPEDLQIHLRLGAFSSRMGSSGANPRERTDSIWAVTSMVEDALNSDPTQWSYLSVWLWYLESELFSLDAAQRTDLESAAGPASAENRQAVDDLRQQFLEHGIALSTEIAVRAIESPQRWEVTDREGARAFRLLQASEKAPIVVTFGASKVIDVLKKAVESLDDIRDRKKLAVLQSMLAQKCANAGHDKEALRQYTAAFENDAENPRYANALGNFHYGRQHFQDAAKAYEGATKADPGNHVYWWNLALTEEAQTGFQANDAMRHWTRAVEAWKQVVALEPDNAEHAKKLEQAGEQLTVHAHYGSATMPVVTPIVLEVGRNVLRASASRESLSARSEALRTVIENETGVRTPAARVREEGDGLSADQYRILINELPAAMGSVDPEASDPVDGVISHLDGVLRRRLADFFGHQEVMDTLETNDAGLAEHYRANSAQLLELVLLCQGLLRQGISLTNLTDIAHGMKGSFSKDLSLDRRLEDARRTALARSAVPGIALDWEKVELPQDLEESIRGVIREDRGLAMTSDRRSALLSRIRDIVGDKKRAALVVKSSEVRPFVGRLVEDELVGIPVVSAKEVTAAVGSRVTP